MKTLLLSSFIAAVCIMQARSSPMRTTSSFYSTNMTNEIIRKAATILNVNYDQLYEANSYFKNSNLQTKTLNIMYFVGYFTHEDFEKKFEEKIDKWLWAVHNQVAYYYSKLDRPFKIAVQSIRYLSFKENRELTVLGMPRFLKKYRGYSDKKLINYDVIVYLSNSFNMGGGRVTGRIGQSNAYAEVGVAKNKDNYEYNDSLMSYTYLARSIAEKLGRLMGLKRSDCQIGDHAQISDIMSSNTNKGVLKETGWSDCTRLLFDLNAKKYFTSSNIPVNDRKKVNLKTSPAKYPGSGISFNDQCKLISHDEDYVHYYRKNPCDQLICIKESKMFDFYKTGEQVYEYPFNTANWPTNYYSFDVLQGTKCAKNAICIDNKCTDLTTNKIIEKKQRISELYEYKVKYNYPCQFQCMITYKTFQDMCSKTNNDGLDECLTTSEVIKSCKEACSNEI